MYILFNHGMFQTKVKVKYAPECSPSGFDSGMQGKPMEHKPYVLLFIVDITGVTEY